MKIEKRTGSYELTVIDDAVDLSLQNKVWNFLLDSEYCVNHYDQNHSNWYPRENRWHIPRDRPAALRLPLAWDERRDHALVLAELGRFTEAAYEFKGNELYVRAKVTSTKKHPNPSYMGEVECAWTQPLRP